MVSAESFLERLRGAFASWVCKCSHSRSGCGACYRLRSQLWIRHDRVRGGLACLPEAVSYCDGTLCSSFVSIHNAGSSTIPGDVETAESNASPLDLEKGPAFLRVELISWD